MAQEISLAASSSRALAPSYEELYGRRASKSAPEAQLRPRSTFAPVIAALAVAMLIMVMVAQRARIVKIAPGLAGAYAAVGLPVNVRGLAFRSVKTTLLEEGSQRVLGVEGQISNLRDASVDVPDMRIAIAAADGAEIYSWIAKSPKSRLAPGEDVYFRARLNAPPERSEKVTVRFAETAAQKSVAKK